jgi:NlpC/P60 family putative phage cell wall peptidase
MAIDIVRRRVGRPRKPPPEDLPLKPVAVSEHADEIVRLARTWVGTPYVHQASVKGAGCDCLGLLRGVWRELRGEEPEEPPPYAPDWAEAEREETLYTALARHLREIDTDDLMPGDVALFRMLPYGPAKHCGIVAQQTLSRAPDTYRRTLIHARQNRRVGEEPFGAFWQSRLAHAFRL